MKLFSKRKGTPILFCHYGNVKYLFFTLKQAVKTNPYSRVILLGDETNRETAISAGAEHVFFKDLNSLEISKFNAVYQHVAGTEHGREFWTNFVFKRWFYVHQFVRNQGINQFWHFDSDNMILTSLTSQEYKFEQFDCTEQCGGNCINGFVSSFSVVDGYVRKIIELFESDEYIEKQRVSLSKTPHYAFTEMRAYTSYKHQEKIKSIRLNSIIDDETFDDCLCRADELEVYESAVNDRHPKKLYLDEYNNFYCYHIDSQRFIKMNSLNLSWLPYDLFSIIMKLSQKSSVDKAPQILSRENLIELNLSELLDAYSEPLERPSWKTMLSRIKSRIKFSN